MFMCVELMLNAVTLTFVTFSRMLNDVDGQTVVVLRPGGGGRRGRGRPRDHRGPAPQAARRHRRRHHRAEGLSVDTMLDLVWLIPALPLAGFLAAARRSAAGSASPPPAGSPPLACGGVLRRHASCVFVGLLGEDEHDRSHVYNLFDWIPVGGFEVDVGFLVDPLSITMALFVTGIGALIHLYSIGYMHGDPKFSKFFVYLNLFVFSMLMLVLGTTCWSPSSAGRASAPAPTSSSRSGSPKRRQRLGRQEGLRHQPHR